MLESDTEGYLGKGAVQPTLGVLTKLIDSAELKALDKARSADPDWYKRGNMFGMTMYTDLFAGNLKELVKKLPYLKEQKLTYLHLMPLLQMPHPHNDGGYAVEDFDTVDPVSYTHLFSKSPQGPFSNQSRRVLAQKSYTPIITRLSMGNRLF